MAIMIPKIKKEKHLVYLKEQILKHELNVVLDLGCGEKAAAANFLVKKHKYVIAVDLYDSLPNLSPKATYIKTDNPSKIPVKDCSIDAVWASHVLEHSCNLGNLLLEIRRILIPNGLLLVAVPPFKYEIVNHFTTGWSVGQLAYVLAGFGFDCTNIRFMEWGYNVLGGGIKSELIVEPTHFGINGVSIKSVAKYLPISIQETINDQVSSDIIRFNGHVEDTEKAFLPCRQLIKKVWAPMFRGDGE